MSGYEILRAGLGGRLVDLGKGGPVHALTAHLDRLREAGELPGVSDVVPGARAVLVDGFVAEVRLRRALESFDPAAAERPAGEVVEIPVTYDGEDLDHVGELTGLGRDGVVEAHTAAEFEVAFCGFTAGFAYLAKVPGPLRVPRLDIPRTAVPAGSVGLADRYTAVYPRRSPGGWQLIGRTALAMWDESADPPALLGPGARVRFVAT